MGYSACPVQAIQASKFYKISPIIYNRVEQSSISLKRESEGKPELKQIYYGQLTVPLMPIINYDDDRYQGS